MADKKADLSKLSCPLPFDDYDSVTIAHGGGGKMMNNLIEKMFIHYLSNEFINEKHDGAVLDFSGGKLAFTTDSYVVNPVFFPGGNIGELAVYGTVNDLSMCGANPMYLSLGLIIEEGFMLKNLEKIIISISEACRTCGVKIITGDTKVVEKGKGDGIFINTAGIGYIKEGVGISPSNVETGDMIILSGDLGRHGISIMALRENLEFETRIKSDCAPLNNTVQKLLNSDITVHCMRDLTRGGLGSALNEIASKSEKEIEIAEKSLYVTEEVRGICEILGIDPLYAANEGRFIAFVRKGDEVKALEILKQENSYASVIGKVAADNKKGLVYLKSIIGTNRILDMLSGEQLPRIC